jgi:hypothetical protein
MIGVADMKTSLQIVQIVCSQCEKMNEPYVLAVITSNIAAAISFEERGRDR